jgi:hypothetical protein
MTDHSCTIADRFAITTIMSEAFKEAVAGSSFEEEAFRIVEVVD